MAEVENSYYCKKLNITSCIVITLIKSNKESNPGSSYRRIVAKDSRSMENGSFLELNFNENSYIIGNISTIIKHVFFIAILTEMLSRFLHEFYFTLIIWYDLRYLHFVYRLIGAVLIGFFHDDPFLIENKKFWHWVSYTMQSVVNRLLTL